MTSILDLLSDGTASTGSACFHDRGGNVTETTMSAIWQQAADASRWLQSKVGNGGSVAGILTNSPAAISCLFGAWRGGIEFASLPTPGRNAPLGDYLAQLERMCRRLRARVLLVERDYAPFLADLAGVEVHAFEDCARGAGPSPDASVSGRFVQFTSGSTSDPKGVCLSLDAIGANVEAMLSVLDLQGDEVAVSWLPLSHDMGLVGMCLASFAAGSPRWAGSGKLVMIPPETYLMQPDVWLDICATERATITAAPNFALARAAARPPATTLDLSALRVLITGAEPVRAGTLRDFADAYGRAGFRELALSPAYGMAEATLAVTMTRPQEHWHSLEIDGSEYVSLGRPLPGVDLRIASGEHDGRVEISSPGLLASYHGEIDGPVADGWFATADVGFVRDGELYFTTRADDVVVVAGRNLYAADVEQSLARLEDIRAGAATILDDGRCGYLVVAEVAAPDLAAAKRAVRTSLITDLGIGPSDVVLCPPRTLPKTPSGKLQRHLIAKGLTTGTLAVAAAD